eukprot:tig00000042_g15462.t1
MFQTSTQRKNWIFTEQELRARRQRSTDLALQHVAASRGASAASPVPDGVADAMDTSPGGGSQPPDSMSLDVEGSEAGSSRSGALQLSVDDALKLQLYFEYQIDAISHKFKFLDSVFATAVTYFKRFYVDNSIIERDPRQILMVCIYVACKTEESYVSAEMLGRELKQEPKAILDAELPLLEALKFNLICYHPSRSITGYLVIAEEGGILEGRRPDVGEKARAWARRSLLTDAPLLYPPGQTGLACLLLACRELSLDFAPLFDAVAGQASAGGGGGAAPAPPADLMERVEAVAALLGSTGAPPEKTDCLAIDKKVRQLRKAASETLRKEQGRREEEERQRRERKAKKRAEEERRRTEAITAGLARPAGSGAGLEPAGVQAPEDPSSAGKRKRALERAGAPAPPG